MRKGLKKHKRTTRQELNIPNDAVVLMCYGQLIERKGADLLIKAFSKRYKNSDKSTLLIIGNGPFLDTLIEQVNQLNLKNIRFIEYLGDKEVCKYYSIADIFVLPSREEAWGLVVNEAMACGLPVLVSKTAGSSVDLVKNGVNGYTFTPENFNDLSKKLSRLIENKKIRKLMGKQSEIISSNFIPQKTAKGFYKMFKYLDLWK